MKEDNGKVAIVTGGGSGIGKASALALLEEGYSVVISGRREDPLSQTVKESGESSNLVVFCNCCFRVVALADPP